jgi:hypothetical protein
MWCKEYPMRAVPDYILFELQTRAIENELLWNYYGATLSLIKAIS